MKHLKRFNENTNSFKNSDDDIKNFFIDYIDEDPDSLEITNGWVRNGEFVWNADYIKKGDIKNYKKAKLVTLKLPKGTGIKIGTNTKCLTSIDPLEKIIREIERFYDLSEEEVNYAITQDYGVIEVMFITMGGNIEESESSADVIDSLLLELKEILRLRGYKRITYRSNFLDLRTPKKDRDRDLLLNNFLRKIRDRDVVVDDETDPSTRALVNWREKIPDNYDIEIGGGDQQVVVKLKKRV